MLLNCWVSFKHFISDQISDQIIFMAVTENATMRFVIRQRFMQNRN